MLVAVCSVAPDLKGLDSNQYSRYKYGSVAMTRMYGELLADLILATVPGALADAFTVTSPGSQAIPAGADLLANDILQRVNLVRADAGLEPAVRAKLHRHTIPSGDYGVCSEAQRRALLANEQISLDPKLIEGRHVVIIDDLWVTGATAELTIGVVENERPSSLSYALIGQVDPALAKSNAGVEMELNHAQIHDLDSLVTFLLAEPVVINQRMCKFVLSSPSAKLLEAFAALPTGLVWRIWTAIQADGLGELPAYREHFGAIAAYAEDHKLDHRAAQKGWL
jgi:hypothetical protein